MREARKRPPAERSAFLDGACGGDPALRQRVEVLLAAEQEGVTATVTTQEADCPTIKLSRVDGPEETVGQTLGRYKVLEKIGEGGFGVVYVAEQKEPVKRRVALKIIKLGMDTRQVVARFEAERQALAMMDHPNIAKVLDAGATEAGRPYFVMELVRGVKLTDYCDQHKLSTQQRLELFIQVCQAIQHAHQKGIIHRDIKPSNILVTLHDGVPMPKVIDFGIAKATQQELTEKTIYTQLQQFIGTPAYMSPEQAEMSGLDIDTRSDIYSLGVLLYELLTGSTPFDTQELVRSGLDQMRKIIREREPVRPSTRLRQTTSSGDCSRLSTIPSQLPTDLDWIVMKCLEKDRTRRYETANGLAADVKRHLQNEPVVARPPSSAYRFRKLVRRNQLVFAATGAVAVALLLGLIASAWQAVRATRAKEEALAAKGREALQRQKAEANEKKALEARASEERLRQQAQWEELAARQRAYASDMNVAKAALEGNNLGRALELLERQRPQSGQKDLRGWEWRYLWEQTRSDALFTFGKITGVMGCLATSPDGRWIVAGAYHKGGLWVWDMQARKEVARLAETEGSVRVAFSPTAPLLALTSAIRREGSTKCTLRIWNIQTRQPTAEFPLDATCQGVAFSADGATVATSTEAGHITVRRIADGQVLASYPSKQGATEGAAQFCVTPDAAYAAYASRDGRIRLVRLRDGEELWTVEGSKEYVLSVAFSPDGKSLASGGGYTDSQIRLWDVATGREIGHLEGHASWVGALVFWPDGKKLASASADETIRVWDLSTGKCLDVLHGHDKEVWRLSLLPDNQTLVSGAKDGTICVWDTSHVHTRAPRITLPQTVMTFRFTPEKSALLTLDTRGQVTRWSGPGFRESELGLNIGVKLEDRDHPLSDYVETESRRFLFSRDGRLLAIGSQPGVLRVWDITRRTLWRELTNSAGAIWPKAFSSDATKLVAWSEKENLLQQWDLTSEQMTDAWKPPERLIGAVFSPDEALCVAIGYEGEAVMRDLARGNRLSSHSLTLQMTDAAFSPDGKLMAVASEFGFGEVWNRADWRPKVTLGGFLLGTHSVDFSPDGERLAVSSDDHEAVRLWETASWQQVLTLQGQGSLFHRVTFSPDGNTIGSSNGHGILHLWTAPSWDQITAAEAKAKAVAQRP
jgi:WD40 repeat protein/tRNA A-37 threonylcarbamoyl transferase component Bud32